MSLRSTTAPGAGAKSGASARASTDLPVPDSPPTATHRGVDRREQLYRQREIIARALLGGFAVLGMFGARRRHLGADGRAHGQEQGQGGQRVEIVVAPALGEITVEHDIGGGLQARARSGPSAGRRGRRARRRWRSWDRIRWRRTAPAHCRSRRYCRDAGRHGSAPPGRAFARFSNARTRANASRVAWSSASPAPPETTPAPRATRRCSAR